jgi:hypothetical protein
MLFVIVGGGGLAETVLANVGAIASAAVVIITIAKITFVCIVLL